MNQKRERSFNLLLITKNFTMGGAEVHVCDLANELANRGYNVFLVAKKGRQSQYLSPNVKFLPYKISDLYFIPNLIKLLKLVKQENIQLVHGHQRLGISMAVCLSKLAKIPNLATVHGQLKYDIRSSFIRNNINKLICVRNLTFEQAKQNTKLSAVSSLILNGVRVYDSTNTKQPHTLMYGSRIDKRHFSVIKMMINEVMPELIKHYPDTKFVIYGQGNYSDELKTLINSNCDISHAIDYRGYTDDLGAKYQEAGLALACGRSAMDALCNGTNVLPINANALGEVLDANNFNYFMCNNFVPLNYKEPTSTSLLKLICGYFDNYDDYGQQFDLFKDTLINNISLDSAINKVEDLYFELNTKQYTV